MIQVLTAIVPTSFPMRDLSNIKLMVIPDSDLIQYVIVIDVNSQNPSVKSEIDEIANHFRYKNVKIVHGKFDGPGTARNHGLVFARTELVCFWDSDDVPKVKNILEAIEELNNSNDDWNLLVGQFDVENVDRWRSRLSSTKTIEEFAWQTGLWRVVFKRAFVESITFPKLRMAEDQMFILSCLSNKPRIEFSSKHFYTYVKHNGYQLTRDQEAMNDLIYAFEYSRQIGQETDNPTISDYARIMSLRQFSSALRNGNIRTKTTIISRGWRKVQFQDFAVILRELRDSRRKI